jgi:hypothetical protein
MEGEGECGGEIMVSELLLGAAKKFSTLILLTHSLTSTTQPTTHPTPHLVYGREKPSK